MTGHRPSASVAHEIEGSVKAARAKREGRVEVAVHTIQLLQRKKIKEALEYLREIERRSGYIGSEY